MKIIFGMPVKDRAWALPQWFEAIESQTQGIDYAVHVILSPSEDLTEVILLDHGAQIINDESGQARSIMEIDSHAWGNFSKYAYMAQMRNALLTVAQMSDVDYYFSLDSDIILPPGALDRLLSFAETHPGVTAPAVNMAIGEVVWNKMEWVDPKHPGVAWREPYPEYLKSCPADVVMAAMLLDKTAMNCRWEATGQGEDIGFCLTAEECGVPRWWVPEVRARHLLRKY